MRTTYAFRASRARTSDRFRDAAAAGLLVLGLAAAALPTCLHAEQTDTVSLEEVSAAAQRVHPGVLLEVELERRQGRHIYEVEILDTAGQVWKLSFDARTGELLKEGREDEHDHARRLRRKGAIVSLETVADAVQRVRPGELLEVELERERGRYVYEVEILDADGHVWELRFDARDGSLLKEEAED
jgi:uncharacterized membrane protein YkoI